MKKMNKKTFFLFMLVGVISAWNFFKAKPELMKQVSTLNLKRSHLKITDQNRIKKTIIVPLKTVNHSITMPNNDLAGRNLAHDNNLKDHFEKIKKNYNEVGGQNLKDKANFASELIGTANLSFGETQDVRLQSYQRDSEISDWALKELSIEATQGSEFSSFKKESDRSRLVGALMQVYLTRSTEPKIDLLLEWANQAPDQSVQKTIVSQINLSRRVYISRVPSSSQVKEVVLDSDEEAAY